MAKAFASPFKKRKELKIYPLYCRLTKCVVGKNDKLVKNRSDGIVKIRYIRRGGFLRERPYIWYAERTKNRSNAVDRIFYDVVKNSADCFVNKV